MRPSGSRRKPMARRKNNTLATSPTGQAARAGEDIRHAPQAVAKQGGNRVGGVNTPEAAEGGKEAGHADASTTMSTQSTQSTPTTPRTGVRTNTDRVTDK